ncbi:sugar transferase [Neobacillus cucumis]|uniref:Sugar transferase n=1 Tax=Neobacillus cucumis TaxID=1740721 RepID=A0A2N5H6F5_9BACI|nr:sugar transferase [Neobacillus cucumis]PLS01105.1 sugar transferase [Neobacillus cucumis]
MKRLFDLLISCFILILFSPIILITAILLRINIGKSIIFKQQRPGLNGRLFELYKFRTMSDARDENGELLPDHLRLSSFGQRVRKWSLDELPQLINVIRGDMSLIGPRPLLSEYLSLYNEEQAKRHLVKPGITGWAQVNGRNAITWEEKFKLDVWYVENRSFKLDLKILFLTIRKVLASDGISNYNHVTMPKFGEEPSENQSTTTSL